MRGRRRREAERRGARHPMRRALLGMVVVVAAVLAPAVAPRGSRTGAAPAGAAAMLPQLHNASDLTDARARDLVAEALGGLGFAPGAPEGPQPADLVFVGDAYVAWIDQTGFYGKLNGLWWLAPTVSGDRSFTLRAADGRPVNQLAVGERGTGAWPKGYRGAEHIEMPNGTPEPGDSPTCGSNGSWCDQYSLDEAGRYTQPGIPWWRACDPGALGWLDEVQPVEVTPTATGLRLVYEGRLVKQAEGQFPWKPQGTCHQDWLFPDGVRRPVHLRVGYELHATEPRVDRLMQVRNPAGNPPFGGPYSFIGGFVLTTWPDPMPEKALNRFVLLEDHDVGDPYLSRTLPAGSWTAGWDAPIGKDIVFGWLGQPVRLSATGGDASARSLRLSHLGPSDNLDTGICLCQAHGAIEMGGGLLHTAPATDAALPVAGGTSSIEARRRLETAAAPVIADVPAWSPPTTTTTTTSTTPTTAPVTTAPAAPTTPPTTTPVPVAGRSAAAATAVAATPRLTG